MVACDCDPNSFIQEAEAGGLSPDYIMDYIMRPRLEQLVCVDGVQWDVLIFETQV